MGKEDNHIGTLGNKFSTGKSTKEEPEWEMARPIDKEK